MQDPGFTGHIDEAFVVRRIDQTFALVIKGWLLHPSAPFVSLSIGLAANKLTATRRIIREDLKAKLPGIAHAGSCGFSVEIALESVPAQIVELYFEAKLVAGQTLSASISSSLSSGEFWIPEFQIDFSNGQHADDLASRLRSELKNFLSENKYIEFQSALKPELSVIVVLFNRAELSFGCLQTLQRELQGVQAELILVDNASSDKTSELLAKIKGAKILNNTLNEHFLLAANQGAAQARGEFLLFLNNDTLLTPLSISNALARMRSKPGIGVVGARLVHPDGSLQEAGSIILRDGSAQAIGRGASPLHSEFLLSHDADFCSAAFMLTPRSLFESQTGFDPAFAPAYYEDVDYCFKLSALGKSIVYEPSVTVVHCEMASSAKSSDAGDLMARNRGVFLGRYRQELLARLNRRSSAPKRDAKKILLVDDFIPRTGLGQGAPRALVLLESLIKLGFEVDLLATNEDPRKKRSDFPEFSDSIKNISFCPRLELEGFFSRFDSRAYDCLLVSRPHNLQSVQWLRGYRGVIHGSIPIIYDAEAIFCRRQILQKIVKDKFFINHAERSMIEALEMETARGVDAILCVSKGECDSYSEYGYERVFVLSHAVDINNSPDREARKGLIMVGPTLENDAPNSDAVEWFVKEVLPQIDSFRKDPKLKFVLVGDCKAPAIQGLAGSKFEIAGFQSELSPFYADAGVFVAPMRYSAGIALKVIEACAQGLPAVVSELVAMQLGWVEGQEYLVGHDAKDFAAKCDLLLSDRALWKQLRENALKRLAKEYSKNYFCDQLSQILKKIGLYS